LFYYLQYFLLGFLLTDFYITKDYKSIKNIVSIPLGILSILCILCIPHEKTINPHDFLIYKFYLIALIFVFFYLAIFSSFWKKVLSIPFVSTVGGMCYSIYLIHFPVINFLGKPLITKLHFSNYFFINYLIINIILLIAILFVSAFFYKKIERPCMKADWYLVLWNRFKNRNTQTI